MTFPFFSSDVFNLILCLFLAAAAHFGVRRYFEYERTHQNFLYFGILFAALAIGFDFLINDVVRRVLVLDRSHSQTLIQNLSLSSYLAVKLFVIAMLFRNFLVLRKERNTTTQ